MAELTVRVKNEGHTNAQKLLVDSKMTVGFVANKAADNRKLDDSIEYTLKPAGAPNSDAFRRAHTFEEAGIASGDVLDLSPCSTLPRAGKPPAPKDAAAPPAPAKTGPKANSPRKKTTARRGGGRRRKKDPGRVAMVMFKTAVDSLLMSAEPLEERLTVLEDLATEARALHDQLSKTFGPDAPLLKPLGAALIKAEETNAA